MIARRRRAPNGATEVIAEAARSRSNLYGFLAAAFRAEPTAELLREMREPAFQEALAAAGVRLGVNGDGYQERRLVDELAQEFTRLFIGPGGHIPPYAAIHLGGEGASLWGPDTVWVKDFIENAGFDYRTDYSDLPDHLGVELEFMQELTAREAEALDNGDSAEANALRRLQTEFLTRHMARWVPEFCRKVAAAAQLPFYAGAATLTEDFVQSEAAALSDGN